MFPLYTTLSLYRCIVRSRFLLTSVVSLLFDWGRASEIDSASRVRAPQLFPIDEACGYSMCLDNERTCNAPEHFPTGIPHLLKTWSLDEWGMPNCFNRRFHLIWR